MTMMPEKNSGAAARSCWNDQRGSRGEAAAADRPVVGVRGLLLPGAPITPAAKHRLLTATNLEEFPLTHPSSSTAIRNNPIRRADAA